MLSDTTDSILRVSGGGVADPDLAELYDLLRHGRPADFLAAAVPWVAVGGHQAVLLEQDELAVHRGVVDAELLGELERGQ